MPLFIDYHEEKIVWSARYKDEDMGPLMKRLITDVRAGAVDDAGVRYINFLLLQDGHGCCIADAPSAQALLESHKNRGLPISASEVHLIERSLAEVVSIDNTREATSGRPYTRGEQ